MATPSHLRFAPPRPRLGPSSVGTALLVHGFLLAALTWGTTWRSRPEIVTASAELWSELPVQAAPALALLPALPTESIPERVAEKTPEIVTEKVRPKVKEKTASVKPVHKPTRRELAAQRKQEKEQEQEERDEQQRELVRQDSLKRMMGLANAKGSAANANTALQSAAPSASYAGKVEAKIRPNIVFAEADTVQGNPAAEVDLRMAADGTILLPIRLLKSSRYKAWDAAVLRAIERTETLPRDTDGRAPSNLILILRPKK